MQPAPPATTTPILSLSSRFSSFTRTNHHLSQTADRVVKELFPDDDESIDLYHDSTEKMANFVEEDEEFEFPSILSRSCSSPVPADEIFCNGVIRPLYSFSFNDLQRNGKDAPAQPPVRRQQLKMLFLEDSNSSSLSSSSDDLRGIQAESYCKLVPPPKTADDRGNKSTKSRWRLMNILNRSRSSGNEGGKGRGGVFPTSDDIHPHGKKRRENSRRSGKCHGGVAVDVHDTVGEVRRR